jgi:murein DD-endopeptidase MepM/ murein hydrolase activator NlpD/Flp pilus assembly protein TadD
MIRSLNSDSLLAARRPQRWVCPLALVLAMSFAPGTSVHAQPVPDQAAAEGTPQDANQLLEQGQKAQLGGEWEQAIRSFTAYLELKPKAIEVMAALGFSLYKKGDLEAAEKRYREALALDNRYVGAGFGLGQIAMARKEWLTAVGLFRDAIRIAPDYEPLRTRHNLALSLFALERYPEAERVYAEAFALTDQKPYAEFYRNALDNELAARNFELAVKWGEEGTSFYPRNAWLWNSLGWALLQIREPKRSGEAYAQAEALAYKTTLPQHQTVLSLPFRGKWMVVQGNHSAPTHRGLGACFAWDFQAVRTVAPLATTPVVGAAPAVAVADSKPASPAELPPPGWGERRDRNNNDFYTFGQEVLAPADGKVVALHDGTPDNEPYHRDASPHTGNYLVIEHAPGELSSLGHLQNGSITVKVGDTVKRGQVIARCGNSGNTSLPHLHYSFIGLYENNRISFPAQFSNYTREKDGERTPIEKGIPIATDIIENTAIAAPKEDRAER